MMAAVEYETGAITVEAPINADPVDLYIIQRYLEHGWLIVSTERLGHALTVHLARALGGAQEAQP